MKRLLPGLFALLLPLAAMGQGGTASAVRKTAEASTLVTGTIVVGSQGEVSEYSIDHPEKLTTTIIDFVGANVSAWKFQRVQVDGHAVSVRNRMTIRLVANQQEDKSYSVRINGVNFEPFAAAKGEQAEAEASRNIHADRMPPPKYPMEAQQGGVSGVVYLVAQVGRDGKVADAIAEQVNLRVATTGLEMERWRNVLAKAALGAAKRWHFSYPNEGELSGYPYLLVRVPVDFRFYGDTSEYGEWEAYIPGPRQQRPWKDWEESPDTAPDAQLAGTVNLIGAGSGLRLLTPLQEG